MKFSKIFTVIMLLSVSSLFAIHPAILLVASNPFAQAGAAKLAVNAPQLFGIIESTGGKIDNLTSSHLLGAKALLEDAIKIEDEKTQHALVVNAIGRLRQAEKLHVDSVKPEDLLARCQALTGLWMCYEHLGETEAANSVLADITKLKDLSEAADGIGSKVLGVSKLNFPDEYVGLSGMPNVDHGLLVDLGSNEKTDAFSKEIKNTSIELLCMSQMNNAETKSEFLDFTYEFCNKLAFLMNDKNSVESERIAIEELQNHLKTYFLTPDKAPSTSELAKLTARAYITATHKFSKETRKKLSTDTRYVVDRPDHIRTYISLRRSALQAQTK